MEIISTISLISINETFFIQLLSFLLFLFVLNRLMFRPLIDTMNQRKDYLSDVRTEIEEAKSDLDDLNKNLGEQRTQAIREANAVIGAMEEEADRTASEMINSARGRITQLRMETETKIDQELKSARSQLAGEVGSLTTAIMEKVLDRRLSP